MSKLLCTSHCRAWLNDTSSGSCAAGMKLAQALQSYFGFACFRPGQLEALLPVAHGQDAFVRMPTGGGKSICMFLMPLALNSDAMGIIISPLVGQQVSCG